MNILLHVCCGPCSLMPVRLLQDEGHTVTGYFANPNIHPVSEYLRRREAMQQAAERLGIAMLWQDDAYNLAGWLRMVHQLGIADNTNGQRCQYCYASRLTLTAAIALEQSFEGFSTSLLYSRHQRHDSIRQEGERAAALASALTGRVEFVYRDFRPAWQQGIDLSKEWTLYRQNYCACVFSEAERYAKKLQQLTRV